MTSHLAAAESAHALVVSRHVARELRHAEHHQAIVARRAARRGPTTIYVAPKGRTGAGAGKNARHPLGNLTVALRRAKNGSTIILAPGVYTQTIGVSGKSNITIEGAADGSSVIASSGDGLRVISSSNITIENLSLRTHGRGVVDEGSSINVSNINTAGNVGGGLVATAFAGQNATVNVTSSHFDGVQAANGMQLGAGAIATISNSTFNNNGASGGSGGTGLILTANSQATISNCQFVGNVNSNLVAQDQSQVTAQGSSFSSSKNGDGAIFTAQASVNLTGNTFASNGRVVGFATGLNGIEFNNFAGSAVVSGNTFSNNTGNGIFVLGSSQTLQITGNQFLNNLVGLNLGAGPAINATVTGNTFAGAAGSIDQGLVASGSNVTATIGGSGALQNTFENYGFNPSNFQLDILQYHDGGVGCPNLTILTNTYLNGGKPVSASQAVVPCSG